MRTEKQLKQLEEARSVGIAHGGLGRIITSAATITQ